MLRVGCIATIVIATATAAAAVAVWSLSESADLIQMLYPNVVCFSFFAALKPYLVGCAFFVGHVQINSLRTTTTLGDAFENAVHVGGSLQIGNNPSLINYGTSFSKLESVAQTLRISTDENDYPDSLETFGMCPAPSRPSDSRDLAVWGQALRKFVWRP